MVNERCFFWGRRYFAFAAVAAYGFDTRRRASISRHAHFGTFRSIRRARSAISRRAAPYAERFLERIASNAFRKGTCHEAQALPIF